MKYHPWRLRTLLSAVLCLAGCSLAAQSNGIVTRGGLDAEVLVKDIFAAGVCETITNVRAIGSSRGIGYFENGGDIMGIERGIMLATGPIQNAAGPNDATDTGSELGSNSANPDLQALATRPVHDAVGLEFDFVPLDSIVTFRYVFASEEYCEYVGSDYNDVFGFFVSGPGIDGPFSNGARNVALVPGTNDYVAINSINYQRNSDYYVGNERPQDLADCKLPVVQSPNLTKIEYDGFTTVLTAVLRLQPCETYHLRLVVADVNDFFFDSAVFLEAESFNIGQQITMAARGEGADSTTVYEGCTDASVRFSRPQAGSEFPVTVNYRIGSASTATPGEDYNPLSGQVTLDPGQTHVDVPITTFADDVAEGQESIWLVLDIPCACYQDSLLITITEPPPLNATVPDVMYCRGGPATVTAEVTGGVGPYTFTWSNGKEGATIEAPVPQPDELRVTVRDRCGQQTTVTGHLQGVSPPVANLDSTVMAICMADTTFLRINFKGVAPFTLTYNIDNGSPRPLTVTDTTGWLWPVTAAGKYRLLTVQDAACSGTAFGTATVSLSAPRIYPATETVKCADSSSGAIFLSASGGTPPYRYVWSTPLGQGNTARNLPSGIYMATVTDAAGCIDSTVIRLNNPVPLRGLQVDCASLRTDQPVFTASGGQPPYEYSTDGYDWFGEELFEQLRPGRYYSLYIRDAAGCMLNDGQFFMPQPFDDMAWLPATISTEIGKAIYVRPELRVPPAQIAASEWHPASLVRCQTCWEAQVTAEESQTLELRMTDVFGCTDTVFTKIIVDERARVYIPNAFTPNGDGKNDRLGIYADPEKVLSIDHVQVFNRWGNLVFEAYDYPYNSERSGWDGTLGDKPLEGAVYIYMLEVTLANGEKEIIQGDVVLVR